MDEAETEEQKAEFGKALLQYGKRLEKLQDYVNSPGITNNKVEEEEKKELEDCSFSNDQSFAETVTVGLVSSAFFIGKLIEINNRKKNC